MKAETRRFFAAGALALALGAATVGAPRTAKPSPGPDAPVSASCDDGLLSSGGGAPECGDPNAFDGDTDAPSAEMQPESFLEPYFPFLDDEPGDTSVSVGNTSHGFVVNARALEENAACAILPKQRARGLRYGTADLVALIEHAAEAFHEKTAAALWVGNIGRRGGGSIPYSVSHTAGRDADIALAYLDATGHPIDPPDLVPLDATGLSKDKKLRFDAARTWLIVKSMLEFDATQIQYIFVSEPLKQKVLLWARAHREPAEVVAHAADVMHQPSNAHPHNDHMHVRIMCSARDVEAGCNDFGIVPKWVRRFDDVRERRIQLAVERLGDARTDQRRRALERLALLDARSELGAIERTLADDDVEVRRAAIAAVGVLGTADRVGALADRFDAEHTPAVKSDILHAAARIGGATAGQLIARALATVDPLAARARPAFDVPVSLTKLASFELASPASPLVCEGASFGVLSDDAPSCTTSAPPNDAPLAEDGLVGFTRAIFTPRDVDELLAAVDAAAQADRLEPVPILLDRLSDVDGRVRAAAADALARITNRRFGSGWEDDTIGAVERADAIASWQKYARKLRGLGRDAWLASGFVAAGYRVWRVDKSSVWELIRSFDRGGYLAYNAHHALERIGDTSPPNLLWSDPDACAYWLNWFSARRPKYQLELAPPSVKKACARASAGANPWAER